MSIPILQLRPGRRPSRLLHGHCWAYRSEVTWPDGLIPGDVVDLHDTRGRLVGRGYANPHSEIGFRRLSHTACPIDTAFFVEALKQAWSYRIALGLADEPCRVCFSEGDGLPGFTVDRYPPVLVMQLTTAGADRLRAPFLEALRHGFPADAIVERSDGSGRQREGLRPRVEVVHGQPELPVTCRFDGLPITVDVLHGQKTGAFLDARELRRHLRAHASGATVLDTFCHLGLFSRYAIAGGATSVTAIDTDAAALTRLSSDLPQVTTINENAFEVLRRLERERAHFDRVILDPPPFTKDVRSIDGALRGYKEINLRGLRLLRPNGLLYTSSCSYHVTRELFVEMLRTAAADAGGDYRVEYVGAAAPDHPIRLTIPETDYFKGVIVRRVG